MLCLAFLHPVIIRCLIHELKFLLHSKNTDPSGICAFWFRSHFINLCNIAGFTAITRYSVPLSEPPRIWAVRLHAAKPLFFASSVELVEKSQTQLPVDTFPAGLSC